LITKGEKMKQIKMDDEELEKHLAELAQFLYGLYQKENVRKLVNSAEDKQVK